MFKNYEILKTLMKNCNIVLKLPPVLALPLTLPLKPDTASSVIGSLIQAS